jgi:FkbM family methyltransferase
MLIPFHEFLTAHELPISGVIHAGAHEGQEAAAYHAAGIDDVLWIEANPATIEPLRAHVEPYGQRVAHACLGERTGDEVTFHVAEADNRSNRGMSSSILPLGTHRQRHPEVSYVEHLPMTTFSLDDLCDACDVGGPGWNCLNMDLQGAELAVLRGAERMLEHVTIVYTEINVDELYQGCGLLPDLDDFLVDHGFECACIVLAGCQRRNCSDGGNRWVGWGDGVWISDIDARPFTDTHPDDARDWY